MKYLVLGLMFLVLLWGFCLWSGSEVTRRFDGVIAPIEQACSLAENGDTDRARSLTDLAFSSWETDYPQLAAFLDHNDLDDISLAFASLADAQEADYLPACRSLLSMLKNLAEADLLLPHNLL